MMVKNRNLCKSDVVKEDKPSGIMNEGITQDGPLKQDIGGGMRTDAIPPNSSQRYTTGAGRIPPQVVLEGQNVVMQSMQFWLFTVDEKTRNKMW